MNGPLVTRQTRFNRGRNSARRRRINISGFVNGAADSPPRGGFPMNTKKSAATTRVNTRNPVCRRVCRAGRVIARKQRAEVIISNLAASAFSSPSPPPFTRRKPSDVYPCDRFSSRRAAEMKREWKNGEGDWIRYLFLRYLILRVILTRYVRRNVRLRSHRFWAILRKKVK